MLGTQSKVKLLEPLFSSSRGYQVEWLRDSYPDKMAESLRSAFNDEIKNGIKVWQEAMTGARNKASRFRSLEYSYLWHTD